MTINEDTGEDVVCPICDAAEYWDCGHLVAQIDQSFGEFNGGALFGQTDRFSSVIEETFIRHLNEDAEPHFSDLTLKDLWEASKDTFDPEESYVGLDRDIFLRFLVEILEDAGGYDFPGPLIDPGGPGMTSSVSLIFADKPSKVIEQALKKLSEELHAS